MLLGKCRVTFIADNAFLVFLYGLGIVFQYPVLKVVMLGDVYKRQLEGEARYCPECGKKYSVVTKETVKRLRFVPAKFEVEEEITYVYSLSLIHI